MKFLKILVLIIVLVLAGLLIFLPTELKIKKEVTIDAPASVVYSQISDYKKWMAWSPWHQLDSAMKVEYNDIESGVGASQSWESEHPEVGIGKMITIDATENERLLQEIYFFDLENPAFQTWFDLEDAGDGKTKITWEQADSCGTFDLQDRLVYAFMGQKIASDYEKGLDNLKNEAEYIAANAAPYSLDIMEKELPAMFVLTIKDSCSTDQSEISGKMGQCFGNLMQHINSNSIKQASQPLTMAHVWDEEADRYVFEAGIPVASADVKTADGINMVEIPAGKYVVGMHRGSYEFLSKSYEACMDYCEEKGIEITGNPMEQYIDDPETKPAADVLTMIAFPVK